jgi:hypothetical protein
MIKKKWRLDGLNPHKKEHEALIKIIQRDIYKNRLKPSRNQNPREVQKLKKKKKERVKKPMFW